ncbi:IS3 family transposase [Luteimicrobium subarcticum]
MPAPHPQEFRDDAVALARKGDAPVSKIAKDLGISESCLRNWMRAADVEAGNREGVTAKESAELRELRKRNRLLEQENEILRRAAAYFAREIFPKMTYPLVRDLAADGYPVAVTCRVLKFSRAGYYAWCKDPLTDRDLEDAYLTNAAIDAHKDDPEFGYRLVADELRGAGHEVGDRRVWRLCSAAGVSSTHSRKRGSGKRPGPPVHDDLVKRQFTASRPNELWLTDITEHWTDQGKVYCCAIKDVYSNKIVGYSISDRMKSRLAVDALESAVRRRGGPQTVTGCVVHSDRGSQFRSRKFVAAINRNGLRGSMGRVGAAGDNAAMESFFALLQKNVLNRHRWSTRNELRHAIVSWIERTYHHRRRQARLGRLTPVEFETIYAVASAA